jgi:hypothetical protein
MTEKIFLSYAHEDRELANAVMRTLREHRIVTADDVVILDVQDFEPGEDLRKRIQDEMRSASKVVILATDNSANSEWVNYEAGMAAALEKPIVILRKGIGKTAAFIGALGTNVRSVEIG